MPRLADFQAARDNEPGLASKEQRTDANLEQLAPGTRSIDPPYILLPDENSLDP